MKKIVGTLALVVGLLVGAGSTSAASQGSTMNLKTIPLTHITEQMNPPQVEEEMVSDKELFEIIEQKKEELQKPKTQDTPKFQTFKFFNSQARNGKYAVQAESISGQEIFTAHNKTYTIRFNGLISLKSFDIVTKNTVGTLVEGEITISDEKNVIVYQGNFVNGKVGQIQVDRFVLNIAQNRIMESPFQTLINTITKKATK